MKVHASAKSVHISPKKVRLVLNVIKNKSALDALRMVDFITKQAKHPVAKVLQSAIANARHNFGLDENSLMIVEAVANDGATLKRWTPKAHGRATRIRKRSSHITIVLEGAEGVNKKSAKKTGAKTIKPTQPVKKEANQPSV